MAVNHEIKQAYGPVGYYNRIIAEDGGHRHARLRQRRLPQA